MLHRWRVRHIKKEWCVPVHMSPSFRVGFNSSDEDQEKVVVLGDDTCVSFRHVHTCGCFCDFSCCFSSTLHHVIYFLRPVELEPRNYKAATLAFVGSNRTIWKGPKSWPCHTRARPVTSRDSEVKPKRSSCKPVAPPSPTHHAIYNVNPTTPQPYCRIIQISSIYSSRKTQTSTPLGCLWRP